MRANNLIKKLKEIADPERAGTYQWFFKTGPGEYGESDKFLGVIMPKCRAIAKEFQEMDFSEIEKVLASKLHEVRMVGLIILTEQYKNGDKKKKKEVFDFYLAHTSAINNWDLVDVSAHKVVGQYIFEKRPKVNSVLKKLSNSKNMWERRIAMVAMFPFIRAEELDLTYELAEKYLPEEHDLMHKVTGWLLREAGKKDMVRLERFIQKHYSAFPRTALRYAIEKFSESKRKKLLKGIFKINKKTAQ
jgi:3-methyladenine DNA glycosylase AlkD